MTTRDLLPCDFFLFFIKVNLFHFSILLFICRTSVTDYNRPPKDLETCLETFIFELILILMCLPQPVVKLISDCIIHQMDFWSIHFIQGLKLYSFLCFKVISIFYFILWNFISGKVKRPHDRVTDKCLYCSLMRLSSEPAIIAA